MQEALTTKATQWLTLLEDKTGPDGRPVHDLRLQIEIFKLASDWLQKIRKMRGGADEPEDLPPGIEALKSLIEGTVDKHIETAIDEKGILVSANFRPKGGAISLKERERRGRLEDSGIAVQRPHQRPKGPDSELQKLLRNSGSEDDE